jgi:hypothetical protein
MATPTMFYPWPALPTELKLQVLPHLLMSNAEIRHRSFEEVPKIS